MFAPFALKPAFSAENGVVIDNLGGAYTETEALFRLNVLASIIEDGPPSIHARTVERHADLLAAIRAAEFQNQSQIERAA